MTSKEKAICAISSLEDYVTLDEVIERLCLLRKIELGMGQSDSGDVMAHDQFMSELDSIV